MFEVKDSVQFFCRHERWEHHW